MGPLSYHVGRVHPTRPKPVILLQRDRAGLLRGYQLCDSYNLATLAVAATREVETLRRAFPAIAFVLVPSDRSDRNPAEQWAALGNPGGFLRGL
jgi:hypothetical protein